MLGVAAGLAEVATRSGGAGHGGSSGITAHLAWVIAGLAVVAAIFRDVLKKWIGAAIDGIGHAVYQWLAYTWLLRRVARRKYLASVTGKNAVFTVPFRRDRPLHLDEVYVPLEFRQADQLLGATSASKPVDVTQMLADGKRILVLGAPGSGKSIFLRSLAMQHAKLAGRRTQARIPVLLELHRLGDSSDAPAIIERELVGCFKRNDFPKAETFVERALDEGHLLLLFDGLDEVPSVLRAQISKKIDDFLEEHPRCPAIVTCRTAAFHEHFIQQARVQLLVAEFTDQLIQQFLARWPGISGLPSVSEFMRVLNENPRMLALARNPLLLTMLAFLYTDVYQESSSLLPRSRADFYRDATDALLRSWHGELNSFDPNAKRQVLRRLSLVGLNRAGSSADRLALERGVVLAEARNVLPTVGQAADNAGPVLREITERSGLLLEIDGGERYQFAHLTLQEYFAATELATSLDDLLTNYDADPDTWRETVRLWCGSASDCTAVVERVFAKEPVLALECVADAARIDRATVDRVVRYFLSQLPDSPDDRVTRALAEVATIEERGRCLQAELEAMLGDSGNRQMAAARILAATHTERAAGLLLAKFGESPQFPTLIASMGDVAVPVLAECIDEGRRLQVPDSPASIARRQRAISAVDTLGVIGTPLSAKALASALGANDEIATGAAWRLGELLRHPLTVDALAQCQPHRPGVSDRARDRLEWVWTPFLNGDDRSTPVREIVGRITFLISRDAAPGTRCEVDPRIATAILLVQGANFHDNLSRLSYSIPEDAVGIDIRTLSSFPNPSFKESVDERQGTFRPHRLATLLANAHNRLGDHVAKPLAGTIIGQSGISERDRRLLGSLNILQQLRVLGLGMKTRYPTRQWEYMHSDAYSADKSRLFRAQQIIYVILFTIAATYVGELFSRDQATWKLVPESLASVSLIAGAITLIPARNSSNTFALAAFLSPVASFMVFLELNDGNSRGMDVPMLINTGSTPSVIILASFAAGATTHIAWGTILAAWVVVAAVLGGMTLLNIYLERRDRNPLRGLFNP